jgi:H/ACA ribonucleoprotein complex subunit 2
VYATNLSRLKRRTSTILTTIAAAKNKALKRGVKECVKAIRKSPAGIPGAVDSPSGIVVLAADISPMDVISHIPVLCEDHSIPYIYVPKQGKGAEKESAEEWKEAYDELNKLAIKMGQTVKV